MKLEDLKPGLYRITQDTPNPALDKRVNSDWRSMPLLSGAVLMCIERKGIDRNDIGEHTEVSFEPTEFGTYLAGVRHPNVNRLSICWRFADQRSVQSNTVLGPTLLRVLEPFPITTVDQALALFNALPGDEISWRDVAIQLIHDSCADTQRVFKRTQARIAAQWALESDTVNSDKFTEADEAFSTAAYGSTSPK